MKRPAGSRVGCAVGMALLAAAVDPIRAFADKHWKSAVSDGTWNIAANWVEGAIPGSTDNVFVDFNDAADHLVIYDGWLSSSLGVRIQNLGDGEAVLRSPWALRELRVGSLSIGADGKGTAELSAGTTTLTRSLNLANAATGAGTYGLSGGTLNVTGAGGGTVGEFIGEAGQGTFIQSGGTNTAAVPIYVGYGAGSAGTYSLSAGTLNASSSAETIGHSGSGVFIQTGGTHKVTSYLKLAANSGSSGSFSLQGGTLSVLGYEYVGDIGAGSFRQSGGTHTLGTASTWSHLYLGYSTGGAGSYSLSGNATLNVSGYEYVGRLGTGFFEQSGGVHTVSTANSNGIMYVGYAGAGTYLLSNGTLNVKGYQETIGQGAAGTFQQSGGVHNISPATGTAYVYLGTNSGVTGTYVLSGGSLNVAGYQYLGWSGNGVFDQSGGTNTLGAGSTAYNIYIGYNPTGTGTYRLSGDGVLNVGWTCVGFDGSGTVSQSGGSGNLVLTQSLTLGHRAGGRGTYLLGGSGTLNVGGGVRVGYSGTGSFDQTGGTHNVGLTPNVGELTVGYGGLGTYSMSGDAVLKTNRWEIVGSMATGTFIQTGGTNTIGIASGTGELHIGERTGVTGSYFLGGGTLSVAGDEYVGKAGTGIFDHSGGTHTVGTPTTAGSLRIGYADVATGTYLLGGTGILNVFGSEMVGFFGGAKAMFHQTGGTHTIGSETSAGSLCLGYLPGAAGGAGTYLLESGALTVHGDVVVGGRLTDVGGTGALNVAGGTAAISGTLKVHSGSTVDYSAGSLSVGTLDVAAGGEVLLSSGGEKVLLTRALAIADGGLVDLSDNDMVIDYTDSPGTLLDDVRRHLLGGRITTSSADTPAGATLGYGDNAVLGKTQFAGQAVDADSVLIKFTYAGDVNLDGQVTISDLGELASNWQSTSAVWTRGDFNYDGNVTIADLGDLASNWQAGVGNPLGMSFAEALAAVDFGAVIVPEPIGLALVPFAWLLKRPRRTRRM